MKECCINCKHKMNLVKFDYGHGGCEHTDYEGFACTALASEGEIVHMVGIDPDEGHCEMFMEKPGVSSESLYNAIMEATERVREKSLHRPPRVKWLYPHEWKDLTAEDIKDMEKDGSMVVCIPSLIDNLNYDEVKE